MFFPNFFEYVFVFIYLGIYFPSLNFLLRGSFFYVCLTAIFLFKIFTECYLHVWKPINPLTKNRRHGRKNTQNKNQFIFRF